MSNDIRNQRINFINDLVAQGKSPYLVTKFDKEFKASQIHEKFSYLNNEELAENEVFGFAGRIMTIREQGKSAFMTIKDDTGRLQAYVRLDKVGQEAFENFKKMVKSGDWIGVKGFPFKTKTGELTILVLEYQLLSKTIRPMPEKWHGLKDKEVKYRQRYVDMISNDETIKTLKTRFEMTRLIREFLHGRDFTEVETPMLQPIMGGANARPFITHLNVFDTDLYLRIAPELYLKRLVVGGIERVFELNKNFRNEGVSYKHNPEFTMIEMYQAYADYNDMMELAESIISYVMMKIHGTTKIVYDGTEIDFTPPFKRVKMREFIKENLGVDILDDSEEKIDEYLKNKGINTEIKDRATFIEELWDLVEGKLVQPTFVIDHPTCISPLTKKHPDDDRLTERFELIIYGRELANAYSELNDPIDQYERFKQQVALKEKGDDEAQMMDHDFIRALEYGFPPTGGMGIGIDRLAMFVTGANTIRDVIAFPVVTPVPFETEEADMETEQTEGSETEGNK